MSQQPPGPPPAQPPGQGIPPAPGGGAPYGGASAGQPTDAHGRTLAEWWKRLVAALIDGFIVGIPLNIITSIIGVGIGASSEIEVDPVTGEITQGGAGFVASILLMSLFALAIWAGYYIFFHGSEKGQTPGKMIMKIQVRDEATGGRVSYGKAFLRTLVMWALTWLTCGIGGILDGLWPLWDAKRQALHDKAANTVVVDAPQ